MTDTPEVSDRKEFPIATSLLALLDDIATVLDDVAVMTKVAAKRTAGVLGDDLALNAEQVSGVRADRELPVVWAVAKGSARNKLILVPVALGLSAFLPMLITPLLMLGGAYLCFEGAEKITHKLLHGEDHEDDAVRDALHDPNLDLAEFEADKIKGAIRTDFVLSAEIIVISMGSVQGASFTVLAGAVIAIAVIMTVGVYGFVAGIVKLDDAGQYLLDHSDESQGLRRSLGRGLLIFSPCLMKSLTVVGTIAMFLVGGGILAHGVPGLEGMAPEWALATEQIEVVGGVLATLVPLLVNAAVGVVAGLVLMPVVTGAEKVVTAIRAR